MIDELVPEKENKRDRARDAQRYRERERGRKKKKEKPKRERESSELEACALEWHGRRRRGSSYIEGALENVFSLPRLKHYESH